MGGILETDGHNEKQISKAIAEHANLINLQLYLVELLLVSVHRISL